MAINMLESLRMARRRAQEWRHSLTGTNIWVNTSTTSNMATVCTLGPMAPNTLDSISMAERRARESRLQLKATSMKANTSTTHLRAKVC